jgi:hypothetical protein
VYVLNSAGVVQSSFTPNHGVNLAQQIVYDSYDGSFVETQANGDYFAIRVSGDLSTVLTRYPEPPVIALMEAGLGIVGMPAVDGTGRVAIPFAAEYTDSTMSYVAIYDVSGAIVPLIPTGPRNGVYYGVAFVNDAIYIQNAENPSLIDIFSASGAYNGNISAPSLGSQSIGQIAYVAPAAGQTGQGALWVTMGELSSSNNITAIDIATGSTTVVYSDPQYYVVYFGLSPSQSVLYYVGSSGISPFVAAVELKTGAVFAQLDAGLKETDEAAEAVNYWSLAVDSAGNVVVPDENSGFRQFAPLVVPSSVLGDPQFVGLRGQSFQVHGIDGAVYALLSSAYTQVNARFVFLSSGQCPATALIATQCWLHPGSYLGAVSVQEQVDGVVGVQQLLMESGAHSSGFAAVRLNGRQLAVGDSVTIGAQFSVDVQSSHRVTVHTRQLIFTFDNSDRFINQQVIATVPLDRMQAHGLLGQTHSSGQHKGAIAHIEGDVDEYVIASNDLFGIDFVYNQFTA